MLRICLFDFDASAALDALNDALARLSFCLSRLAYPFGKSSVKPKRIPHSWPLSGCSVFSRNSGEPPVTAEKLDGMIP
jgi:hypothetical protein